MPPIKFIIHFIWNVFNLLNISHVILNLECFKYPSQKGVKNVLVGMSGG